MWKSCLAFVGATAKRFCASMRRCCKERGMPRLKARRLTTSRKVGLTLYGLTPAAGDWATAVRLKLRAAIKTETSKDVVLFLLSLIMFSSLLGESHALAVGLDQRRARFVCNQFGGAPRAALPVERKAETVPGVDADRALPVARGL